MLREYFYWDSILKKKHVTHLNIPLRLRTFIYSSTNIMSENAKDNTEKNICGIPCVTYLLSSAKIVVPIKSSFIKSTTIFRKFSLKKKII